MTSSSAYIPPKGSLAVPHPRTVSDILVRSALIHISAVLAYGLLLSLLSFRRPHGPPLSRLLILAFVLLPELVLLQLAFWTIPALISPCWRARVVGRFQSLPRELEIDGLRWLLVRAGMVGTCMLVLVGGLMGYEERLKMRYHEADYVGNLMLDHRNGWVAVGGLAASVAAFGVIGGAEAAKRWKIGRQGEAEAGGGREEDEKLAVDEELDRAVGGFDWSSFAEVLYATLIHQILLSVTNRRAPLVALLRSWPLLLVGGVLMWFFHTKRGARLDMIMRWSAIAIVSATVLTQLSTDASELYAVAHGIVERYNYRWAVKDVFSAKIPDSYRVNGVTVMYDHGP